MAMGMKCCNTCVHYGLNWCKLCGCETTRGSLPCYWYKDKHTKEAEKMHAVHDMPGHSSWPQKMKETRARVLELARECVCSDRQAQYGSPENNFALIATFWGLYLEEKLQLTEVAIEAEDVAMMMALLKIARCTTGQVKLDNYVDLAGYAACGGEIAMGKRKEGDADGELEAGG